MCELRLVGYFVFQVYKTLIINFKRKCFPDGVRDFFFMCREYTLNKHRLNVRDFTSVKSMKLGVPMVWRET